MVYNDFGLSGEVPEILLGSAAGALVAFGIMFAMILALILYVYFAMAWMTIGKKLKYRNSWLAWIPVANMAMMLQLGGFHWAWIFLILIPIVGWIALFVLIIIATWRVFEARRYPGWFSLSMIIPQIGGILYLIAIGFVAWKDKRRVSRASRPVRRSSTKKRRRKR